MGYDLYLLTPLESGPAVKLRDEMEGFLLEKANSISSLTNFLRKNFSDGEDLGERVNMSLGEVGVHALQQEHRDHVIEVQPKLSSLIPALKSEIVYGRSVDLPASPILLVSFYFWRKHVDFRKCVTIDDYGVELAEDFFQRLLVDQPKGLFEKLAAAPKLSKISVKHLQAIEEFLSGGKALPKISSRMSDIVNFVKEQGLANAEQMPEALGVQKALLEDSIQNLVVILKAAK